MGTSESAAETESPGADQGHAECEGDCIDPTVSPAFPSRGRLVLLTVVLPATVALTNQLLFKTVSTFHWSLRPWLLYCGMALTTAALSWCSGRYLSLAWLRWLIFAWCLVLLDLLAFAACLNGPLRYEFAFVLVSAQIGLVILWTVLAGVQWQWRLPGTAVAVPLIILYAGNWGWPADCFGLLVILAAVVVTLVCSALRWRGFVLQMADRDSRECRSAHPFQFGIKHLLVWATAAAPLLLVARGLDFVIFASLDRQGAFPAMLMGLAIAAVNVVAIWSVLGVGYWPLRMSALFVGPICVGYGLDCYAAYTHPAVGISWGPSHILWTLWNLEGNWTTWLWPNSTLFAALLLFMRASSYQLLRQKH